MENAFTVDVEDYFQVSAFAERVRPMDWLAWPSRVEANTDRILELAGQHDVRGTFYILGWVAEHFPHVVRRIHAAGHEIGFHSGQHELVYRMTPSQFREDVRRGKRLLEDLCGDRVTTYRAPSFSVTPRSFWALELLIEEGYVCDSSVFPIHHDRYGIPGAPRFLFQWQTPSGLLWEFPPTTVRWAGINFPVGGGGYFRLLPGWLSRALLQRVNERENQPFMFYIHPWEIDAAQPRVPARPWVRWRHTLNLSRVEERLARLFRTFRFESVRNLIPRRQSSRFPHEICWVDAAGRLRRKPAVPAAVESASAAAGASSAAAG